MKGLKPAFTFLIKFVVIYLVGNTLYGVFIKSFQPAPDPLTVSIAYQTSAVLSTFGYEAYYVRNPAGPTAFIYEGKKIILNVYEGCTGINVMIIFAAFLVAFGGRVKTFLWFLPIGLLIIHIFNLLRLLMLFLSAKLSETYFYYFHKYIFTVILYLVVFVLWYVWITRLQHEQRSQPK